VIKSRKRKGKERKGKGNKLVKRGERKRVRGTEEEEL